MLPAWWVRPEPIAAAGYLSCAGVACAGEALCGALRGEAARARDHRRGEHEAAPVERLEAGDAGRWQRSVCVFLDRRERAAVAEGVLYLARRGASHPCHAGNLPTPVELVVRVHLSLGRSVHGIFYCPVVAVTAALRLVADAVGVVTNTFMGTSGSRRVRDPLHRALESPLNDVLPPRPV